MSMRPFWRRRATAETLAARRRDDAERDRERQQRAVERRRRAAAQERRDREAEEARLAEERKRAGEEEIRRCVEVHGYWWPRSTVVEGRLSGRPSRIAQFIDAVKVGWDKAKRS
ncbi:MAG: hypothetical protein HY725_11775 [Candidatus Rokubacteria bacterium]|nr:hypothetical protein [Candidatus Rokubacteria bacterium]